MDDVLVDRENHLKEPILKPVGVIKNGITKPPLISGKDGLTINESCGSAVETMTTTPGTISEVVLEEGLEELLDGIDDYSHLIIVYWGHEVGEEGRRLKRIHPAGLEEYPLKGIYSTCSPARPNPVLITAVKLLERDGRRLKVMGLDAIDNSPVIDIKPYVAELYSFENVTTPDWMEKLMKEFGEDTRK